MALRAEGRPLHATVIVRTNGHTIHTSVLNFTMFTATTVLCNIIKCCPRLEISLNNFTGILKNHQGKNKGNMGEFFLFLEMLQTLYLVLMQILVQYAFRHLIRHQGVTPKGCYMCPTYGHHLGQEAMHEAVESAFLKQRREMV